MNPEFELEENGIDIVFQSWAKIVLNRGIDGSILLQVLEDRGLPLIKDFPHFAQQLRNNELGVVVDYDGITPKLLDFHQACADGDSDLVQMYCECKQDVNEEQIGRNDSIARTPLMLAAMNNHVPVIEILVNFKAEVRGVDRLGRTALHLAAMAGCTEACTALLKHGGRLYDKDHSGNTALHLAAFGNNPDTVDYLCYQSKEYTRAIISDKVRCRSNSSFQKLTDEVFEDLPKLKLSKKDQIRFEKLWLKDASILFINRMDPSVSQYVAPANDDIVEDVLARFDPRPETGITIFNPLDSSYTFVPTIATSEALQILLGCAFRQASIDLGNNLKRSALHVACENNRINSHEKTIVMLIDVHGASCIIKDRYGYSPLKLLIEDKKFANSPTASQVREEVIINERETRLLDLNSKLSAIEEGITTRRRQNVLDTAINVTKLFNSYLWNVTREASILRTVIRNFEEYIDPDTQSLYYCKQPINPLRGDVHTDFRWFEPPSLAVPLFDRYQALAFLRTIRSDWLRTCLEWRMYRLKNSDIVFYYHMKRDIITFRFIS